VFDPDKKPTISANRVRRAVPIGFSAALRVGKKRRGVSLFPNR
jgi:hypothetical protein